MKQHESLQKLISDCVESIEYEKKEKFIGWESIVSVLVYQGLLIMLPELKEWLKLGANVIALKRQEIKKKLIAYAAEKDLDFPQAEIAAGKVADQLDEKKIKEIVTAFEDKAS